MTNNPVANYSIVLREDFEDYALFYNPDKLDVFILDPDGSGGT